MIRLLIASGHPIVREGLKQPVLRWRIIGYGAKMTRRLRCWLWLAASTLPVIILLSAALLLPKIVWAGKAELFIRPTFVELTSRQHNATITIENRGDATRVFVISWVDIEMSPQGGVRTLDGVAPWSLQPRVRYSPHRVTLHRS